MGWLIWSWAAVYLVGHIALWKRVDREWLDPNDERREDYSGFGPPEGGLTVEGEQLWRRARRFTAVGFLGWVALVIVWFSHGLLW